MIFAYYSHHHHHLQYSVISLHQTIFATTSMKINPRMSSYFSREQKRQDKSWLSFVPLSAHQLVIDSHGISAPLIMSQHKKKNFPTIYIIRWNYFSKTKTSFWYSISALRLSNNGMLGNSAGNYFIFSQFCYYLTFLKETWQLQLVDELHVIRPYEDCSRSSFPLPRLSTSPMFTKLHFTTPSVREILPPSIIIDAYQRVVWRVYMQDYELH